IMVRPQSGFVGTLANARHGDGGGALGSDVVAAFQGNERPLRRLTNMTSNVKEQQLLWKAAARSIGHALKYEFECDQQNVPDRIRQLVGELEAKGDRKRAE